MNTSDFNVSNISNQNTDAAVQSALHEVESYFNYYMDPEIYTKKNASSAWGGTTKCCASGTCPGIKLIGK